jgi:hypothetical protein
MSTFRLGATPFPVAAAGDLSSSAMPNSSGNHPW